MKKWTVMIAVIACLGLIVGSVGLIRNFTTTDNSLATLTKQIEHINNSLPQLGTTDTELKNYIADLEQTAQQLQTKLTDTNAKFDKLESEIYGKVDSEKNDTLAQLNALKTDLAALKAKDTELASKIEELKNYVDTQDTANKTWANATFATLKQYNAIRTEIAGIKESINTINAEITAIKSRLNALESDVAGLLAQIQSVNYIPMYDDGKVKVAADTSGNKYAFFDFMISPKSVLANVDEATLMQCLSMQAVYTGRAETRGDEHNSITFVDMEILDVAYNATTGVLTVKASGDNLSADFYNADVYASAFLTFKTWKTEITSDYIPMVAHSNVWVNVVTVEDWINVTVDGGTAEEVIN